MTDFTYLCTRNVCVLRGEKNMSLLQKLFCSSCRAAWNGRGKLFGQVKHRSEWNRKNRMICHRHVAPTWGLLFFSICTLLFIYSLSFLVWLHDPGLVVAPLLPVICRPILPHQLLLCCGAERAERRGAREPMKEMFPERIESCWWLGELGTHSEKQSKSKWRMELPCSAPQMHAYKYQWIEGPNREICLTICRCRWGTQVC